MIKGLYAAASAMLSQMERQTILSHNISNVDTPGFKTIMMGLEDWKKTDVIPQEQTYPDDPNIPTMLNRLSQKQLLWLGEIGLGVQTSPETIDYEQGSLQDTNEPLDFAVEGDGFFHIQTPDGDRYTRDGRFLKDSEGTLVTSEGYKVLSQDGQTITVPDGEIAVGTDGMISVDGNEVAQIGLFSFENVSTDLIRDPSNLYIANGSPLDTGTGQIRQGSLEMSNVSISQMTSQMISVARSYEAAQKLVTVQDQLLSRSFSTLGKV